VRTRRALRTPGTTATTAERPPCLTAAPATGDVETVRVLLNHPRADDFIDLPGGDGETALHRAAQSKNLEGATAVVELLLERGADPTIKDLGDQRAIDVTDYKNKDCVKLLEVSVPWVLTPSPRSAGLRNAVFSLRGGGQDAVDSFQGKRKKAAVKNG
jgi:hypothetical protein